MTQPEALILIEKLLLEKNIQDKSDLTIDYKNVTEISTHWIIPAESKRYLDSRDSRYKVRDIRPYAIDKISGKIDPTIDTSWMQIIAQ